MTYALLETAADWADPQPMKAQTLVEAREEAAVILWSWFEAEVDKTGYISGDIYVSEANDDLLADRVDCNGVEWWHADSVQIVLEPTAPACIGDGEHRWVSDFEWVGGIEDNPGVWGHGGGVIIDEVCEKCHLIQRTDTWGQDPMTGEQGLKVISYRWGDE